MVNDDKIEWELIKTSNSFINVLGYMQKTLLEDISW